VLKTHIFIARSHPDLGKDENPKEGVLLLPTVLLPTKLVSKQICTREKKKRFIPGRRR
jgi:hypothetical protein